MTLTPVSAGSAGAVHSLTPAQSLKQPILNNYSTLTRSGEGKKSESGGICGFVSSMWNKFVGFVKWLFCCCGLFGGSETKAPKTKEELDALVKKLEEAQDSEDINVRAEAMNDLVSLMNVKVGGTLTSEVRRETLEKLKSSFDDLARDINPEDPEAGWKLFLDDPNHPDVVKGIEKETRQARHTVEFAKLMMEAREAREARDCGGKVDAVCKILKYGLDNPGMFDVETSEQMQEAEGVLAKLMSYPVLSDDEKRAVDNGIDGLLEDLLPSDKAFKARGLCVDLNHALI